MQRTGGKALNWRLERGAERSHAALKHCPAALWIASLAVVFGGCDGRPDVTESGAALAGVLVEKAPVELDSATEAKIEAFCGDCHALPRPESFPKDRWHWEIRRGYEFYAKSGRTDLDPPPLQQTLAYFRTRAPEQVEFPEPEVAADLRVQFREEELSVPEGIDILPEIASLRWARLADGERHVMLASDIRHGHVVAIDLAREARRGPRVLGVVRNPSRIEVCDLDADGHLDLVVADLGSYLPADHDRGQVVLLRRKAGTDGYEQRPLLTGLGRVADVRASDIDGDGRLDLIVAEFGWRDTGKLLLARNVSDAGGLLRFEVQVVDDRPGAIDVRVHDFTADGRPDLAVVFSQEYESLEIFQNLRANSPVARLARRSAWAAPDLTFGFTGIELVDLNADGRMDILGTNGDAFDNDYVTPWHGVQWFESLGGLQFAHRRLTDLPGAYRARAGDFDQDGLLDIVAVARLPGEVQPASLAATPQASIVLMHQAAAGVFQRYTLERGSPHYPAVEVGDFDGDGRLDFAVACGPYSSDARQQRRELRYLSVWWNETNPQAD